MRPTAAWLDLVRNSAMDRFEQLGFPSVKEEDWKYTNLATLAKEEFVPVTSGSTDALQIQAYPETAETHLVVVDGFLREDLSTKTGLGDVVAMVILFRIVDKFIDLALGESEHLAQLAHDGPVLEGHMRSQQADMIAAIFSEDVFIDSIAVFP